MAAVIVLGHRAAARAAHLGDPVSGPRVTIWRARAGVLFAGHWVYKEYTAMQHDDALRLQQEIARQYPDLRCQPRQYGALWSVEVTNPRTNEQINVVDPATWQDRLLTMLGAR
jgi:hypothetical protein